MMNKSKNDNKEDFEGKEGKIKRNEWRKLISVAFIVITLYLLNVYNVFDYTGYIIGILLVLVWSLIINYIIDKIFSLFI